MPKQLTTFLLVGTASIIFFGCKSGGPVSQSGSTNSQTASQTQTQNSGVVPEDLTFSGTVSGHMTEGRKGDTYVCATATTEPIVGKIGDTNYPFKYLSLCAKRP